MSLLKLTEPEAMPVSVEEMKAHTRVDADLEDATLAGFIRSASEHIEDIAAIALITATWEWTIDRFPPHGVYIRLPVAPVSEVTSIAYLDTEGVAQALDPAVILRRGDRIVLAPNAEWPATWRGLDVITVTFQAGYGDNWNDVPHALRQATAMLAAYWFELREAAAIGPDSGPVSDVPFSVKQLVEPYRLVPV
jgi:uncharacterized phiE125 gp8 family phage protein